MLWGNSHFCGKLTVFIIEALRGFKSDGPGERRHVTSWFGF